MKDEKKKITDTMITNVLYKLSIISYIKQGEKLYCDDESNIFVDDSYIPSLTRYFNNQNRLVTTKHIKDIIDDVTYITDFVFRNETIEDISRYGISCFEEPHCIQHRIRSILHFGSILDLVISYINEDEDNMKYYTVDIVISKPTPTKKIKQLKD